MKYKLTRNKQYCINPKPFVHIKQCVVCARIFRGKNEIKRNTRNPLCQRCREIWEGVTTSYEDLFINIWIQKITDEHLGIAKSVAHRSFNKNYKSYNLEKSKILLVKEQIWEYAQKRVGEHLLPMIKKRAYIASQAWPQIQYTADWEEYNARLKQVRQEVAQYANDVWSNVLREEEAAMLNQEKEREYIFAVICPICEKTAFLAFTASEIGRNIVTCGFCGRIFLIETALMPQPVKIWRLIKIENKGVSKEENDG